MLIVNVLRSLPIIAALGLCACESSSSSLNDTLLVSTPSPEATNIRSDKGRALSQGSLLADSSASELSRFKGAEVKGTGEFISPHVNFEPAKTATGQDGVTLNLVNVPIATAAKTILGDILKLNYAVSDKVAGNITIQTTTAVPRDVLVSAFEDSLKANGASLVENDGFYKITPGAVGVVRTMRAKGDGRGVVGSQLLLVPVRQISAAEMKRLMDPVLPNGTVVRADTGRNLLILSGTSSELSDATALVELFDVDWMRGMSFALVPVKVSDPEAIVTELETIFGVNAEGPLKGVVRFIANRRLGSVLVISSKPAHIETAREWIEKLDKAAQSTEKKLFVYKIQNRSAVELADLLQKVLSEPGQADEASTGRGEIAPRYEREAVVDAGRQTSLLDNAGSSSSLPRERTQSGDDFSAANGARTSSSGRDGRRSASFQAGGTKVVADEVNNALVVQAVPNEYDRILKILERLDVLPTQVLLEAVIAEVTLNDELRFGVKWHFEKGPSEFTLTNAISGAVASAFPGFSYFFQTKNVSVALDALSSITKVNVVSAPSLMVMDNRKAMLQVGDQVPIITQTAQSVTNPDSPVVNAVTLKDTGVILAVTPHVNESGRIVLDIEQEVSNVAVTTSSGIDSPTIQQRRVKTTVVVADNEIIALGGLIQQRDNMSKGQVPILGNLPVVGSAFRTKTDKIDRTELIIFMRPQVVRDIPEARLVTDEFRKRINLQKLQTTRGGLHIERDLGRAFR